MSNEIVTAATVAEGAATSLADYPRIATRLVPARISAAIDATYPAPPPPLIYMLWIASSDFIGRDAARRQLSAIDTTIALLEFGQPVAGAWRSRVRRLLPPRPGSKPGRYVEQRSDYPAALFEILLACQLAAPGVTVDLLADGREPACDIALRRDDGVTVGLVEAYAPRKGGELWYAKYVDRPWREVTGQPMLPPPEQPPTSIFIDPTAMTNAMSNVLTDGNFRKQKARQLAAGDVSTVLASRAYGLVPDLKHLLAMPPPDTLANEISAETWAQLPMRCSGLLLCFTTNELDLAGANVFIPAPARSIHKDLADYLQAVGVRH
jgi:hypothetical protein